MKAKEIYEYLLSHAIGRMEPTCDGLIAGDERKEVKKLGTCFKLTADLIAQAKADGIDMMITHEPTFSRGDDPNYFTDIDRKKWDMLIDSDIALYRFHDHAHHTSPDYIHEGFIRSCGFDIMQRYERESLGVSRYELDGTLTVRDIARLIGERLSIDFVRIVGDKDIPVKVMCLGLGSVGHDQIQYLFDPGCDLFITGEVGEVCTCEYVRDACFLGEKKAVILLGHFGAEYAGMRYLAEVLDRDLIPTCYFHSKEVYEGF